MEQARDILFDPGQKLEYDYGLLMESTLTLINQEYASPNPNYYILFQATRSSQPGPLPQHDKNCLNDLARHYEVVVNKSQAANATALIACKFIPICREKPLIAS